MDVDWTAEFATAHWVAVVGRQRHRRQPGRAPRPAPTAKFKGVLYGVPLNSDYARVAEQVEAWGFRTSQDRGEPINRRETALLWLENEYRPVVQMLHEADLVGRQTETEAYMRVSAERYRLLRTHRWDEAVIGRVVRDISRKAKRRRR
jgi:hypothetical protein